ncbi:MAG: hypothetical protein HC942_14790 [Microcoleus sp. SU_5_6]|nr:hypothetical protein [Microcoleus sp. SU_5_6]
MVGGAWGGSGDGCGVGCRKRSRLRKPAASRLPDDLRDTVVLVLGEELTQAEAGAVLGLSEGTVAWRMSEVKRRLKAAGIRTVQYVSPQVWAWRQGRVRTMHECCDRVLCLLPFETEFYAAHGVDARFVGHPLADTIPLVDRATLRHGARRCSCRACTRRTTLSSRASRTPWAPPSGRSSSVPGACAP